MEIKILYDNNAISDNVLSGWGFSCLIDNRILFDTGPDGESILYNIKKMGVDIAGINDIVISHDHWDHTGGLKSILRYREGVNVHICPGFSSELKDEIRGLKGNIIENENFIEIKKDLYLTGSLQGRYKDQDIEEQALVFRTDKGITVFTGCAHPGIVRIVEVVRQKTGDMTPCTVIGGFHLNKNTDEEVLIEIEKLKVLGVEKTGPAHCVGEEALDLFKKSFGNNFVRVYAGSTIEV